MLESPRPSFLLVVAVSASLLLPACRPQQADPPPLPTPPSASSAYDPDCGHGRAREQSVPTGVTFPAGYTHIRHQGIDSEGGCIVKPGGPMVHYELCCYTSWINQFLDSPNARWKRTLPRKTTLSGKVFDDNVKMAMFANNDLYVSVGGDAYRAEHVRTPEDLADVLFIAMGRDREAYIRAIEQELKDVKRELKSGRPSGDRH
jgi:hypothetical protein